jgi:DNA-directed RNA polymerase specialized sigma24 family protein
MDLIQGTAGSEMPEVDRSDRERFTAFYHREHAGQVRRAALLLGSVVAAEDVVHQAFVEVWRRWGAITDPGPYLNRCVLNGARDAVSVDLRQGDLVARLGAGGTDLGPEHEVITDALAVLPFNHRAVLVLRFYAGWRDDEIAAALGCPSGSIGPWIHRGLAALRKALS